MLKDGSQGEGLTTTDRTNLNEIRAIKKCIDRLWSNLSRDSKENVFSYMDANRLEFGLGSDYVFKLMSKDRQVEKFPAVPSEKLRQCFIDSDQEELMPPF
ncbi:hypothetical protein GPJ56_002782 [Histomonas meleagridis]|uniref:uncharacterized protein n=1 Tax=Histomonas meleagridis TaxID=135588 RepID=UPI00355A6AB8|nr:hypothetical protein GPJ56_002782 [Histomonas meleagridis]KAH0802973.1 hypothetical protein GO595_004229 [Histomonas meleagridis]